MNYHYRHYFQILILCCFLFPLYLQAQAPQKMSYQAVIRDAANALLSNEDIGMQISILQGSVNGTSVYTEVHYPTTNVNGLASLEIGTGTIISGSFSAIDWSNGPYFIKTETDPAGGSNYTITSTTQLLSVPYALYAETCGNQIPGPPGPPGPSGGFVHYVGEHYGGGVVFYVWKDTSGYEHGYVVSLNDQSNIQIWSNVSNTLIGTSAQSWIDGVTNTQAVLNQAGHITSAARQCDVLVSEGYSDWYLPSAEELHLLLHNRIAVNKTLSALGETVLIPPFSNSAASQEFYWSSTEYNATQAIVFYSSEYINSADGLDIKNKFTNGHVRAIRAF